MRWAELALFLSPFALFAAWRLAATLARPALVWGTVAIVVALATGIVVYGLRQRERPGETYVPARIVDGTIVPGHGVPHAR